MANIVMGQVDCLKSVNNTGAAKCPFDIEQIVGAIHVPKDSKLTAAEMLVLKTAIDANIQMVSKAGRWFPVQTFVNVEDKSSELQMETTGYGGTRIGPDGKYHWVFEHDGKLSGHKQLSSFHNMQSDYAVYFIDGKIFDNGAIIGVDKGDGNLYPFPVEMMYVPLFKIGGAAGSKASIGYQLLNSDDLNQNVQYVPLPSTMRPSSIVGLEQTYLAMTSATLSSTGACTLELRGDTTNLYDRYSTNFGNIIKAYNNVTGAAITITSTTPNAIAKNFAMDLDSADMDWPASAGGEVKFVFGDMDDIIGENIYGLSDCELVVARA